MIANPYMILKALDESYRGNGRARSCDWVTLEGSSPLCKAKRASNAARPPRADRFLQSAMSWVETPPPRAAIGLLRSSWVVPNQGCTEGALFSHRGRSRGGRPLPVAGIFGAGKEGLALEPAPPGAGRPSSTPPLVPDKYELRVGWGLRAAARREGRPHLPTVWWVRVVCACWFR